MVKLIDSEHLKSRIKIPQNSAEADIVAAMVEFIDSEPEYENNIRWVEDKVEKKNKNIHAVNHGFKCSKCKYFQLLKTNYCSNCGGRWSEREKKEIKLVERFLGDADNKNEFDG